LSSVTDGVWNEYARTEWSYVDGRLAERLERAIEGGVAREIGRTTWTYAEAGRLEVRAFCKGAAGWQPISVTAVTRSDDALVMETQNAQAAVQKRMVHMTANGDSSYAEGPWNGPGPNVEALEVYGAEWR